MACGFSMMQLFRETYSLCHPSYNNYYRNIVCLCTLTCGATSIVSISMVPKDSEYVPISLVHPPHLHGLILWLLQEITEPGTRDCQWFASLFFLLGFLHKWSIHFEHDVFYL